MILWEFPVCNSKWWCCFRFCGWPCSRWVTPTPFQRAMVQLSWSVPNDSTRWSFSMFSPSWSRIVIGCEHCTWERCWVWARSVWPWHWEHWSSAGMGKLNENTNVWWPCLSRPRSCSISPPNRRSRLAIKALVTFNKHSGYSITVYSEHSPWTLPHSRRYLSWSWWARPFFTTIIFNRLRPPR